MKYLIVGIDPGTTVAIAILDLNGKLIHLESGKKLSIKKVTEIISQFGQPVIISTDVAHLPDFVKRVAAVFNSKVILPAKNLRIEEKKKLAEPFDYFDDHQRDSLAAAIFAYKKYEPLFNKVNKIVSRDNELIKKKLILGEANSIKDAMRERENKQIEKPIELRVNRERDKRISELETEIKRLEESNKRLVEKKLQLEKKLKSIEESAERKVFIKFEKKLKNKDYTIRSLEEIILENKIEISNLNKEIKKLNKKIEMIMKGYIPVIRVKKIKEILKLDESVYGHAVIIEEPYTKISKPVKEKIEKLAIRLTKGKTFEVDGIEFLDEEEGDTIEKIQDIIERWRKRKL